MKFWSFISAYRWILKGATALKYLVFVFNFVFFVSFATQSVSTLNLDFSLQGYFYWYVVSWQWICHNDSTSLLKKLMHSNSYFPVRIRVAYHAHNCCGIKQVKTRYFRYLFGDNRWSTAIRYWFLWLLRCATRKPLLPRSCKFSLCDHPLGSRLEHSMGFFEKIE